PPHVQGPPPGPAGGVRPGPRRRPRADPGDVAAVLRLLDALRGAAAPARELRPLPHPARPGTHRPRPLAAGGPRRLLPGPPPHGRRPPVAGARSSFLFLPGFLPGRG